MAEQAIRQRSEQLKGCFQSDLEQFRRMLSVTLVETGSHLFEHLNDLIENGDLTDPERTEEIDSELASYIG